MALNNRSGRSSRHQVFSGNSSFASLRTNSSASLVSFFGTTSTAVDTGNGGNATTRLPRRIRARTLSNASLSSSSTKRRCFHGKPQMIWWLSLAVSLVLFEQLAVFYSWLATDYNAYPESVAASLSASVSTFTATASLSVSSSGSSLFSSNISPVATKPGLHIVVSHCDKSLDWLWHRVLQAGKKQQNSIAAAILKNIKSVTIFSKCGQEGSLKKEPLPPMADIVILPNVGRCDHSYAYWIAHVLRHMNEQTNDFIQPSLLHSHDAIWFVKDNDNSYRSKVEFAVSLEQMLQTATQKTGFACGSQVSPRLGEELGYRGVRALNVAAQKNMGRFQMYSVYSRDNYTVFGDEEAEEEAITNSQNNQDTIRDPFFPANPNIIVIEDWIDTLPIYNLTLGNKARRGSSGYPVWDAWQQKPVDFTPPPQHLNAFMPICFGGIFLTTFERLKFAPVGNWSAVVESLSRGDNIEEGHFMERLWAALLSPPMSQEEQQHIQNNDYKVVKRSGPYKGLVLLQSDSIENEISAETNAAMEPVTWWSRLKTLFGLASADDAAQLSPVFDIPSVGMHVVVSHCEKPIDWIWDRLLLMTENVNLAPAYPVKSITVLTKCGHAPRKNELPRLSKSSVFAKKGIDPVRIVELSNVGGSHHSYAYWIAQHLQKEKNNAGLYFPQDLVLFVQDSDNTVYHRQFGFFHNKAKFRRLYEQTLEWGFSCGNTLPASALLVAPGVVLSQEEQDELDQNNFALNIASKKNLGNYKPSDAKSMQEWVDRDMDGVWNVTMAVTSGEAKAARAAAVFLKNEGIQSTLNRSLLEDTPTFVPVCLGGHFMVAVDRILAAPVNDWDRVAHALHDDSDSIRFLERLWALLLSHRMHEKDQKAVLRQEFSVVKRTGRYKGMVSILKKTEPPLPARKKKGWKTKREPFLKQWSDQEELLKEYW